MKVLKKSELCEEKKETSAVPTWFDLPVGTVVKEGSIYRMKVRRPNNSNSTALDAFYIILLKPMAPNQEGIVFRYSPGTRATGEILGEATFVVPD